MKPLCSLLFLLFAVSATFADVNNDGKKTALVVKKVGKRFWLEVASFVVPSVANKAVFSFKTPEEKEESKKRSAQQIAESLLAASSHENDGFQAAADLLYSITDSNFVGGICGGTKQFYWPFYKYLDAQRKTFKANDKQPVVWRLLPTSDDAYNTFRVAFRTHSTWGYNATRNYIVQTEVRAINKFGDYMITGIEEVGGCTEHGDVDVSKTDMGLSFYDKELGYQKSIDKTQSIEEHLRSHFATGKEETQIPFEWSKLTAADVEFKGAVCDHEGVLKEDYSREEMFEWFEKFRIMYRPADGVANHTEVQRIGGDLDNFVFRVSMKVQIGTNPEKPVQTFDFKVQFAKSDIDELYYIQRFEVMCMPELKKLWEDHAYAYREIIFKRLNTWMSSNKMWWESMTVLEDLVKNSTVKITMCAAHLEKAHEIVDSLSKLTMQFWADNKKRYSKMEGFDYNTEDGVSRLIEEKTGVEVYVIWTPYLEHHVHESRWGFGLEWDPRLQFYHIYRMQFECPQQGKGNKYYNSLRLNGK